MAKYIALLRGINVSGQKIIRMEELRELLESMGLRQVRTYIQSGNAVFHTEEESPGALAEQIAGKLKSHFGFEVGVIVRTPEALEEALAANPFTTGASAGTEEEVQAKRYYSFLEKVPDGDAVDRLRAYANEVDEYRIAGDVAYILCRGSYGKSQFSNNFLESKLKVMATTRNEATIRKLVSMCRD
ncbi:MULTISPECIES: DUF1697 domain-containing protein [Paenibacillus]|uniref:DUF1697 domain-containing protein n=1 Tax=Paenibacillus TaxID=44249 RepID=UPI0022B8908F|nr:DUF1697 domain-containing protein [Paenibacillus caseinilyticus]MCZ8522026.1 DUF1697 domain-containing protein [Paenibacillus caseinilyticus]